MNSSVVRPVRKTRGGDQQIWTMGLNWQSNSTLRFMVDHLDVDVDRPNPAQYAF